MHVDEIHWAPSTRRFENLRIRHPIRVCIVLRPEIDRIKEPVRVFVHQVVAEAFGVEMVIGERRERLTYENGIWVVMRHVERLLVRSGARG